MRNTEGFILAASPVERANESQDNRVYDVLAVNRGRWLTLNNISELTGIASTGSIASAIRRLRADMVNIEIRNSVLSRGRIRIYEYMLPFSI